MDNRIIKKFLVDGRYPQMRIGILSIYELVSTSLF